MKVKLACMALLMGASGITMAAVSESCPEPSSIRQHGVAYSASTSVTNGEWLGVVSSRNPMPISAFESATLYAGNGSDETVGVFNKCTYITQNNERVDLRYRPGQASDIPVKLMNVAAWKRSEGPFGLVIHTCTDQEKGACAFEEINH